MSNLPVDLSTNLAVDVRGLTKKFGNFTAVDNVSFSIPRGEIFGLLGPNGAGKTTTIRMLCGIMTPSSGSASILGYDVVRQPEEIKKNIGYMSQKFALYDDLTVNENLVFYAGIYSLPRAAIKSRVAELVEMAGLTGHEKQPAHSLSGAWRQRLALACAIVHRPPMLFLDEPTAGVDPVSRREFWALIYEMAGSGVTVLATTHYMDEAEYCNAIGMMYNARLIALNDPDALKAGFRGDLYEVECADPARAVDLLLPLPGITSVNQHGVMLHISATEPAIDARIRSALAKNSIHVQRVERIIPSLEDAFISIINEEKV